MALVSSLVPMLFISVSIPKRVSEVLWRIDAYIFVAMQTVSIPKRVSEVLWLAS